MLQFFYRMVTCTCVEVLDMHMSTFVAKVKVIAYMLLHIVLDGLNMHGKVMTLDGLNIHGIMTLQDDV